MDLSKVASVGLLAAGTFYLGYRYARSMERKRMALSWQFNFEALTEELNELKESFKGAAADVQKRAKSRYEAITAKVGRELHRTDVLELLRSEIHEVQTLIKGE